MNPIQFRMLQKLSADINPESVKLYNAITKVENNGRNHHFQRTNIKPTWNGKKWVGGSTAYGPAQITGTLMRDQLARYPNEQYVKDNVGYINRFVQQSDNFNKYGMTPKAAGYHKRYDYGGAGDLTSPEDMHTYHKVGLGIVNRMYNDNYKKSSDVNKARNNTINQWRGVDDPDYRERINNLIGR